MSDRASTQIKFNDLLKEYRKDILPLTVKNYDTMSEAQQLSLGKLCNFFCGLHALVHLAEVASSAAVEAENGFFGEQLPIMDGSFLKAKEPGATRLIRTACKAAAQGGDKKSGCHGTFLEYMRPKLRDDGFHSLPLEPFRGNRFNILFQNAASVFFLHDDLTIFLKANATNRLLKAVLFDMEVPEYVAGCKAYGLIAYLITMPFWSSVEDTRIHLMDIGARYREIIDYITTASQSIQAFITGQLQLSFCNAARLQSDRIFQKLVLPWEHDDKTEVILLVILPAMTRLLQRMFHDHLEGGKWTDVSDEMRERTKGLPKHMFSESIFGHLDRLMREKPNMSTIATEACLMFSHNHTLEWLQMKPHEVARLLSEASKAVRKTRKCFKERQQSIQKARRAAVAEIMRKQEELTLKRLRKKEQQTADIVYWGLWQTEQQVDDALASMGAVEQTKALKAQLNFRQHVLKQKPADPALKCVYSFSKSDGQRRVQLSREMLAANIKLLIKHSFELDGAAQTAHVVDGSDTATPILVGKRVRHRFALTDGEQWFTGKVISQVFT